MISYNIRQSKHLVILVKWILISISRLFIFWDVFVVVSSLQLVVPPSAAKYEHTHSVGVFDDGTFTPAKLPTERESL